MAQQVTTNNSSLIDAMMQSNTAKYADNTTAIDFSAIYNKSLNTSDSTLNTSTQTIKNDSNLVSNNSNNILTSDTNNQNNKFSDFSTNTKELNLNNNNQQTNTKFSENNSGEEIIATDTKISDNNSTSNTETDKDIENNETLNVLELSAQEILQNVILSTNLSDNSCKVINNVVDTELTNSEEIISNLIDTEMTNNEEIVSDIVNTENTDTNESDINNNILSNDEKTANLKAQDNLEQNSINYEDVVQNTEFDSDTNMMINDTADNNNNDNNKNIIDTVSKNEDLSSNIDNNVTLLSQINTDSVSQNTDLPTPMNNTDKTMVDLSKTTDSLNNFKEINTTNTAENKMSELSQDLIDELNVTIENVSGDNVVNTDSINIQGSIDQIIKNNIIENSSQTEVKNLNANKDNTQDITMSDNDEILSESVNINESDIDYVTMNTNITSVKSDKQNIKNDGETTVNDDEDTTVNTDIDINSKDTTLNNKEESNNFSDNQQTAENTTQNEDEDENNNISYNQQTLEDTTQNKEEQSNNLSNNQQTTEDTTLNKKDLKSKKSLAEKDDFSLDSEESDTKISLNKPLESKIELNNNVLNKDLANMQQNISNTEKTDTPQTMTNTTKADVINQIYSKLNSMNNNSKISMVLNPESLGKVSVQLTTSHSGVNAEMVVSNSDVKELLEENLTKLKDTLSAQGVSVNNISVRIENSNSNTNMDYTEQENSGSHSQGNSKKQQEQEKDKNIFEELFSASIEDSEQEKENN